MSLTCIVLKIIPARGDLHDDVILLLRPESFRGFLSCAIKAFIIQTSLGLPDLDSGRSSKMTPSCKWPIDKL